MKHLIIYTIGALASFFFGLTTPTERTDAGDYLAYAVAASIILGTTYASIAVWGCENDVFSQKYLNRSYTLWRTQVATATLAVLAVGFTWGPFPAICLAAGNILYFYAILKLQNKWLENEFKHLWQISAEACHDSAESVCCKKKHDNSGGPNTQTT